MQRIITSITASIFMIGVLTVSFATPVSAATNSWGASGPRNVDVSSAIGSSNTATNYTNNNSNSNQNPNTGIQFYVQTNASESVTSNSAVVGGYVSGATAGSQGWVEYGTTQNFGAETNTIAVSNGSYAQKITGLRSNTVYYYRAVATSGNSISRGMIRSFTTDAGAVLGTSTTAPTPYVKIGFAKYVANISNQNGTSTLVAAAPGDTLRYTIIVSNVGTKDAKNVVVIDQLDPSLSLVASGADTIYDSVTRTLSWNVGTVSARTYKSMSFDVKVGANASIVTNTATLRGDGISTKTTNKTQVVVAKSGSGDIACAGNSVASTNGNKTNTLNAAGLGFLPQTLAGWFVALLLVAVIAVLVYRLFRRQDPKVVVH